MSLATEKDEVLTRLNESREMDLMPVEILTAGDDQSRFYNLFLKHHYELEQAGFIEYHTNDGAFIEFQRANMKPGGYIFLLNGGYTAIERKLQLEEERQRIELKWRRGYEGLSLMTAIAAAIIAALTYFFTPKNSDIEALQTQIRSLTKEVSQLKRLKAVEKSTNSQNILPARRIPGR